MALYASVSVCALLAAALVYRYDLYNREPLVLLGATAVAGAVCMPLVGRWEAASLGALSGGWASAASYSAVGASHEELFRFVAVWIISRFDAFDDPIDGLVYGSIFGLGMGLEESFDVMRLLDAPAHLVFPVEIVRLLGHLVMGGITGFGFGIGIATRRRWRLRAAGCLAFSMLLHFSWDWLALVSPRASDMPLWQTFTAVGIILIGMFFYGILVVVGSRWSREQFDPESSLSLWGWPLTVWFRNLDS